MVARPGTYQASFNAGELAPAAQGRFDIKQFYAGARVMQNVEPVPQGGFTLLPGTRTIAPVRGLLTAAGGTLTLTLGPHTAPAVIAELVFTSQAISAVDVTGLTASQNLQPCLALEVSPDGVTWTQLGPLIGAAPAARTRRRARAPGQPVTATRARLRLTVALTGATTFGLAGMVAFRESAASVVARDFGFSFSVDQSFTAALTAGHADIWEGDVFRGCVSLPYTAAQLPQLKREQRLNTMLLFHPDVAPQRIIRSAADGDWASDAAAFENIPLVDYGEAYGNVVNDVWLVTVRFDSNGPANLLLELTVNGEAAYPVGLPAGPDYTTFINALKMALEATAAVAPGIAISLLAADSTVFILQVTFSGAGNTGQRFRLTAAVNNVTWAAATTSNVVFGDPGGEAIMSAGRGWPVTGTFYQDRLYLGGFRSEPGAALGSITGEYYDLNVKQENAAGALLFRLDTTGAERIEHLARARHLVLFTNAGEYYVSDRAIVRGTPPNIAQNSENGCAPLIAPVSSDGGLIYIGRSRSIIYAAKYSDVTQTYESEPISLLASHLCVGLAGAAVQRANESTDAERLYLTRDDGVLVVGVMIRNQDITAFVRFVTDGQVKDVCVDGAGRVSMTVRRQVNGQPLLIREIMDDDMVMHGCMVITQPALSATVTGLSLMEGATVWALADGYADGPHVVTDGQITLRYAASEVVVGRWTPPIADTLPLPRLVSDRVQLARPVRVHTVRVRLVDTTSLAIAANGRAAREVALLRAGDAVNQPLPGYTGPIAAEGLQDFSDEGIVRFTQLRPGRLTVRDTTIEAKT